MAVRSFGAAVAQLAAWSGTLCLLYAGVALLELALFIRLSAGCYRVWLLEHGVHELSASLGNHLLVWYLFVLGASQRCLLVYLNMRGLTSLEALFRNARWLERESGEMHDLWFSQKRDRRALFLVPLLYWGPLRKAYPVSGFYELRFSAHDGRLYPHHVSWLD